MSSRVRLSELRTLRTALYGSLGRRRDALFEMIDATSCGGAVDSLPHLSLVPVYQRRHGSVYAALSRGRLNTQELSATFVRHPLAGGQPAFAVDVSVVARCDAETSPGRAYYHHPSRHSAGQPIVAGWAYSWVAQLGTERSSWTAPVDAVRLVPGERPETVAIRQVQALALRLAHGPVPLFVFDAGYSPSVLTVALADRRAAVLVRFRNDRVFFHSAQPRVRGHGGRPRRHGTAFRCGNQSTWGQPDLLLEEQDAACGHVEVRCWSGLHGRVAQAPGKGVGRGRGPHQPLAIGWVIRVTLDRTPNQARPLKPLWLWYAGPTPPDPQLVWRAYVHRFDVEHTLRFCKERLGWDRARVRTPEQMDRWTWVVLAAYTQLRLARGLIADCRLPWERPRPPDQLTPWRVLRGFGNLVGTLGTPANAPQPCGLSPGRPKDSRSGPAPRFPALRAAVARAA
jgi:DDE family transposase